MLATLPAVLGCHAAATGLVWLGGAGQVRVAAWDAACVAVAVVLALASLTRRSVEGSAWVRYAGPALAAALGLVWGWGATTLGAVAAVGAAIAATGLLATRGASLAFVYCGCAGLAAAALLPLGLGGSLHSTSALTAALSVSVLAATVALVARAQGGSSWAELRLAVECEEQAEVIRELIRQREATDLDTTSPAPPHAAAPAVTPGRGTAARAPGAARDPAAARALPERSDNPFDTVAASVLELDTRGRLLRANRAAAALCAVTASREGTHIDELVSLGQGEDEVRLGPHVERALRTRQPVVLDRASAPDLELYHPDGGRVFPVTVRIEVTTAVADGAAPRVTVEIDDITELRSLSRLVTYQESHDPLTGLTNRREFMRRTQARAHGDADDPPSALCFIDLDHLDAINDTCGHRAGDALLRLVADRLAAKVRGTDALARVGGDQFALFLEGCPRERAVDIAQNLLDGILGLRFPWDEHVFEVSASVGIATTDSIGGQYTDCYGAAHAACQEARRRGGSQIYVHDPAAQPPVRATELVRWMQRVRGAIEHGQFRLEVQPIMPVNPAAELEPRGEFLVRIVDAPGTLIPPDAFIAAAEHYDLMPLVDRWVIEHAVDAIARRAPGLAGLCPCAVNLSGQSVGDPDLLDFTLRVLDRSRIDPAALCFEITETAVVRNFEAAQGFIRALVERGCQFSLDDFGTGSSSYAYLKNLPVSSIKIDGTFVRALAEDQTDQALVASINQMGHALGMRTVAEHVESEEVLAWLRRTGVDYAQGERIGAPRPVD